MKISPSYASRASYDISDVLDVKCSAENLSQENCIYQSSTVVESSQTLMGGVPRFEECTYSSRLSVSICANCTDDVDDIFCC